jgi:solute carrier family 45, member 1/2/4
MANITPPESPGRPKPPPIDTNRASPSQNGAVATHPKIVSFRRSSNGDKRSKDFGEPNEQSPLLEPRRSTDSENGSLKQPISPMGSEDSWNPQEEQQSKSTWYMFLLTFAGLGLQIGWSVEMSNGSPYLLSLGLSKTLLALVWIAGPLSGVIVQPIVGMKSDRSRVKWGRRRPYIVGGGIATILAIMILAWTREIVTGFFSIFGVDPASRGVAMCVMLFAVLFIYVLDFAINVSKYNNGSEFVNSWH